MTMRSGPSIAAAAVGILARDAVLAVSIVLTLVLLGAGNPVNASGTCNQAVARSSVLTHWFDPHPADDSEISLPIPARGLDGVSPTIVFTVINLSDEGLFPEKNAVFTSGSELPQPFESNLPTRIASPLFDTSNRGYLVLGKYELSKAQFALLMGDGDLMQGTQELIAMSGERPPQDILDYLDTTNSCHRTLTLAVSTWFRTPVTFLTADGYRRFLRRANVACYNSHPCRNVLLRMAGDARYPAFLRLPTEHEWEFAARGGFSLGKGALAAAALQSDTPALESGTRLADYAHLDGEPQRLLPIGTRKGLHGFYDLFGNAQELVAGNFTSETGFGAVGGLVARGGHFRLGTGDFRLSRRVELTPYRRNEDTGVYYAQGFPLTGIRLAIGAPLASSLDFDREQKRYADAYVPLDDARDAAGDSLATAKSIGILSSSQTAIGDELGDADNADIYTISVERYGPLSISASAARDSNLTLRIADGTSLGTLMLKGGVAANMTTAPLLPDETYILTLAPASITRERFSYALGISQPPIPDTGLDELSAAALAFAVPLGRNPVTYSGYIGFADPTDTLPIRQTADTGAVEIQVTGNRAELILALRRRDGTLLHEARIAPDKGSPAQVIQPMGRDSAFFVELRTASPTAKSEYRILISPTRLDDSGFATAMPEAPELSAGIDYRGTLTVERGALFGRIELPRVAEVTVIANEFSADAALTLLDQSGTALPGQSSRVGVRDELFKSILPSGRYFVKLSLAGATKEATPFRLRFTQEARSTSALDPRQRALADIEEIAEANPIQKGRLSPTVAARYYRFVPRESGHFLISAYSSTLQPNLALEAADGAQIESASALATGATIVRQLESGVTYRFFVSRPPLSSDQIDYTLRIERIGKDILLTAPEHVDKIVGIHENWVTYNEMQTCVASTPPLISGLPGPPSHYIVRFFHDRPTQLYEGIYAHAASDPEYTVEVKIKNKWKPLAGLVKDGLSATSVKCDTDTSKICFSADLFKMLLRATDVRFKTAIGTNEYSLRGFRAASQNAGRLCKNKIDIFR